MAYQIAVAHASGEGSNLLKAELDDQVDKGKFFLQKALNKVFLGKKPPPTTATAPAQTPGKDGKQSPFFRKGRR